jgi:hypothetical protein
MKTATGSTVRKCYSRIGTNVDSYESAVNAVGFSVFQEPIARVSNGREVNGKMGLFRSDNGNCLEIHSDKFSLVQPSESLRVLERARELVNGSWASVQVNKGGRMIAGFVEVENSIVAPNRGDTVALSLAYFDHFDGNGLARLTLSACNLTCTNGMTSLKNVLSFSSKHIGDIGGRLLDIETKLNFNFLMAVEEMKSTVVKLDAKPMAQTEVTNFARQLFPAQDENDVPSRTENMRNEIVAGFSHGTGNQGRTRWDTFNAVTEYLDWSSTFRETEHSAEENRFESLLSGRGANTRQRALELLLA